MYFFITLLTAIALSLDSFTLSIIYGVNIFNNRKRIILSTTVGLFHFFMPLLGYKLSNKFFLRLISKTNILSFIIFLILGIEMIINKNDKEKELKITSIFSIIIFALTVSIDSFSIGIAISQKEILLPIITFSIVSTIFTYVGLRIGNSLNKRFDKYSNKLGGLILIALSIYYLFT